MKGSALIAPIPARHFEGAIAILKDKPFVLFGSEAWELFSNTEMGSKVFVYISHDQADPVVKHVGTYEGMVGDPMQMRKLEKEGYRPPSTAGEKWGCFWKLANLQELAQPIPLSEIQLASGGYLDGYPRGPLHVIS